MTTPTPPLHPFTAFLRNETPRALGLLIAAVAAACALLPGTAASGAERAAASGGNGAATATPRDARDAGQAATRVATTASGGSAKGAPRAARGAAAVAEQAAPREAATLVTRLSNERTDTAWAHPARVATIRARPSRSAPVVARTALQTEVGRPNVYLVLALGRTADGERWLKVRVPGRPNGRTGWVLRGAVGPLHRVDTQIVVDRRALTATLLRRGRRVLQVRVGVGAAATPTPAGRFWVREKLRFASQPLYGSHALGTSAYAPTLTEWPAGGVVGIHGTDQPWLIPGRPSHGCVRVRNPEMAKLWRATPIGTPVLIR